MVKHGSCLPTSPFSQQSFKPQAKIPYYRHHVSSLPTTPDMAKSREQMTTVLELKSSPLPPLYPISNSSHSVLPLLLPHIFFQLPLFIQAGMAP